MTPEEATNKLFEAAQSGRVSDAQAALAAGADPNAKHEWQQTPLHVAVGKGHTDLIRLLIEKGAEVNARDDQKQTPLHWIAARGNTELARLLIEKGADPNAQDRWQQSPLHRAAIIGNTELARLLIEKGADPNARDDQKQTPLHCAVRKGNTDLAELLATAECWHAYLKPLLGPDKKLDARQLVDDAGQPTAALNNLLPNDLLAFLARPGNYRQGMDGLVLVFPHLPEKVQASIDLTPWRRTKAQEANEAAPPEGGWLERYSRRVARRRGNDDPEVG